MFLTRLLLLVFALVLIRFVFRFVRELTTSSRRRPEVHRRPRPEVDPTRGGRIIDVEFTEDPGRSDSGEAPR